MRHLVCRWSAWTVGPSARLSDASQASSPRSSFAGPLTLVVFPAWQNRGIIQVIEMAADQKPFGVFFSKTLILR